MPPAERPGPLAAVSLPGGRARTDLFQFLPIGPVAKSLDLLWLIDQGQGHLLAARRQAEIQLAKKRGPDNLLACGLVHQLQGEYGQALHCYEEAWAAFRDPELRAVLAALASLAEHRRVSSLPDGRDLEFAEVERWRRAEPARPTWAQRWKEIQADVRRVPAKLIGHLVFDLEIPRGQRRTMSTRIRAVKAASPPPALLSGLADLHALAEAAGVPEIRVVTAGEFLFLRALAGWDRDALRDLDEIIAACSESGDMVTEASLQLIRGDVVATPAPLGSPLVFGYLLDGAVELSDSAFSIPDPAGFNRSVIDVAEARRSYEAARRSFAELGAPRGVGMADLRLAYLLVASRDLDGAAEAYRVAEGELVNTGDNQLALTAYAGRVWTGLWRGIPLSDLTDAGASIASRARASDAPAWGAGWGLTFLEAAKEALSVSGDVETALRATRVSEAIFEVLDIPLRRSSCNSLRARAMISIEASDEASIELQEAFHWLRVAASRSQQERECARTSGLFLAGARLSLGMARDDPESLVQTALGVRDLVADVQRPGTHEFEAALAAQRRAGAAAVTLTDPDSWNQQALDRAASDMRAGAEGQAVVRAGVLHAQADWVESQCKFQAAFQRGGREMDAGRAAGAADAFEDALRFADLLPDRDMLRGMVYTRWERVEEARLALGRYVEAGLPGGLGVVGLLLSALPGHEGPAALGADFIKTRYEHVAAAYANADDWGAAAAAYRVAGLDAATLAHSKNDLSEEGVLHALNFALIAEANGDSSTALEQFESTARQVEEWRRLLRRDQFRRMFNGQRLIQRVFGEWVRALSDLGQRQEAFDVAERARSRSLSEILADARRVLTQGGDTVPQRRYREHLALLERLSSLLAFEVERTPPDTARIRDLYAGRQRAMRELDSLEVKLLETAPRVAATRPSKLAVPGLAEVCTRLPADTVLIAYYFHDRNLFAWCASRDGLLKTHRVRRFAGRELRARPFAAQALSWAHSVAGGDPNDGLPSELAAALIAPFDESISSAAHVVFVPYAQLNMVPLHVLAWRGRPLGLQRPVSYLPAASLLEHMEVDRAGTSGALVVGDPAAMSFQFTDTGPTELEPLPGARLEAIIVARAHGVEPLLGGHASEDRVREAIARTPDIIHLATHGCLQPGAPLDSGIALAGGQALTVDELMGLELHARIVVLSACDTARGALQGSEIVGLTRGVLIGGAQTAVVSLWAANDVATMLLMDTFHRDRLRGRGAAQALLAAQERVAATSAAAALNFMAGVRRTISAYAQDDPMVRGSYHWCVGDILDLGGDGRRAREEHRTAAAEFSQAGEVELSTRLKSLAAARSAEGTSDFEGDRLIFRDACDWAPFVLVGNWR